MLWVANVLGASGEENEVRTCLKVRVGLKVAGRKNTDSDSVPGKDMCSPHVQARRCSSAACPNGRNAKDILQTYKVQLEINSVLPWTVTEVVLRSCIPETWIPHPAVLRRGPHRHALYNPTEDPN